MLFNSASSPPPLAKAAAQNKTRALCLVIHQLQWNLGRMDVSFCFHGMFEKVEEGGGELSGDNDSSEKQDSYTDTIPQILCSPIEWHKKVTKSRLCSSSKATLLNNSSSSCSGPTQLFPCHSSLKLHKNNVSRDKGIVRPHSAWRIFVRVVGPLTQRKRGICPFSARPLCVFSV